MGGNHAVVGLQVDCFFRPVLRIEKMPFILVPACAIHADADEGVYADFVFAIQYVGERQIPGVIPLDVAIFAEYLDRYGLRFGITRLNKHLRGKNSVRTERILFSCEGSRNQDSGALHGVSRGVGEFQLHGLLFNLLRLYRHRVIGSFQAERLGRDVIVVCQPGINAEQVVAGCCCLQRELDFAARVQSEGELVVEIAPQCARNTVQRCIGFEFQTDGFDYALLQPRRQQNLRVGLPEHEESVLARQICHN